MTKKLELNEDKCNETLAELLKTFKKYQPTVGEILLIYGNLGYSLGASIAGCQGKGPGVDELKKMYYESPKDVAVALMLEGITVTSWFDGYEEQVLENTKEKETPSINKEKENQEEKNETTST